MRRLRRILCGTDTETPELFCATVALLWGAGLTNPSTDTFGSNPQLFHVIAAAAPEHLWGLGMLVIGGIQLWGLFAGKTRVRLAIALFGFGLWVGLSVLFWMAVPETTAPYVYTPLAFLQLWVFLRLSGEVRHV